MAVMALPRAALGAKLKETVIAGNWPWWLIERYSELVSKCENAPRGTALLFTELAATAELAALVELVAEALDVRAFGGGERVFGDAVSRGEVVKALEPAEVEPFPVVLAGAPDVPDAAFA